MSQAGYTPIQLYYSTTASASPSAGNMALGELAINATDGKLFFKDNVGNVKVIGNINFAAKDTANTFTALQTFSGSASSVGASFVNGVEKVTISATAATGTINYDVLTQSILYYTSNAAADWTLNIRGSSGASLDSLMSTGQALTIVFLVTTGATAYKQSALTIDGASVTPKWINGVVPSGFQNSINTYVLTIIKTGSAAFTALESLSQFK